MPNTVIKRDFDKHMIWPHGQCGHFALSTLLETWLKDVAFEINIKQKWYHKKYPNPKMSMLTPKTKNVSYLDMILHRLTNFDTF